jgi:hypothetical protein
VTNTRESRIAKIKLVEEALEIHLERLDDDTEQKTAFRSRGHTVHPDLSDALQALQPHVRDILCLPADWCANAFDIRSISFSKSEKTGVEGAVVSCSVDLTTCNSPFFFNTPYLPIQRHTDEGVTLELSQEAIDALEKLKSEAHAYLDGKRAQRDLFDDAEEFAEAAA